MTRPAPLACWAVRRRATARKQDLVEVENQQLRKKAMLLLQRERELFCDPAQA